ncbi:glycosyltransferase [Haliangium ochraceum]|uniref:Glycosyl transferase group 1 n=1 Tax=Haliangium ochraceum (strain DSM 14365 / JCM 11303 / SMP-2) TaxID=502025 RepID=D0LFR5_HALO1|nr:glycosyltransferase [Haliangium ochraceum]ACY14517.1 glycosyl transferase group 1 [Haliangium ochraceum DSM 14365]
MNHRPTEPAPPAPLRLLLAVTDPRSTGFLRGQLAAARAAGFEVSLLSGPGPAARALAAAEHARLYEIPMARAIAPARDLVALARVARALAHARPHIVNAGTPKAALLTLLAARALGVPCRIHTLHGLRGETLRGARRRLLDGLTRVTSALAQRVICVSPSLAREAVAAGVAAPAQVLVLGRGSANGIDLERFCPSPEHAAAGRALRARCGIPDGARVLGFVGRLADDKGVAELARAWSGLRRRFPDLHWLVLGAPDDTDPVPAEVLDQMSQDPRVHCLGQVADPRPAYAGMDVLALPTRREGLGYALIEAAAFELPSVATRVTGCVDAVHDGVTGTLVARGDTRALAAALAAYLDDPALRRQHGHAGRAFVAAHFEQRALWARLHREYARLAAAAALPGAAALTTRF